MRALVLVLFFLAAAATDSKADILVWASWYGKELQGRDMANGEPFDRHDPTTAAHRTLPFGSKVVLANPENGRELTVVIRDRGPFVKTKDRPVFDLTEAGANILGYREKGKVKLRIISIDTTP